MYKKKIGSGNLELNVGKFINLLFICAYSLLLSKDDKMKGIYCGI